MKKIFRFGERRSPLSIVQAEIVRSALLNAHPDFAEKFELELVPIGTSGDWKPEMGEKTLEELGSNKGLFTKEIDEALTSGHIDVGIHSMKDVATFLPSHLAIAAILERADPREAFISQKYVSLAEMPPGATVGTSSLRRRAQVLSIRPDLNIVPLRGNVETRLAKLDGGAADAIILALAGLQRLSLGNRVTKVLDTDAILPAAGQGAIGVVIRRNDAFAEQLLSPINHAPTNTCVTAERAFLAVLDGSCRTPIAALGRMVSEKTLVLEGVVARADGTEILRLQKSGGAEEAATIGTELGHEFMEKLSPACKAAIGIKS